jgi:succinyl-CoA synthetase beta subunit
MIVVEHDAKELLAVQGVPVPGGVMLRQVPKYDGAGDEPAGPWLVKPQIPDSGNSRRPDNITAHNAREIAEATKRWIGEDFLGHTISSVRVERKLIADQRAHLSFVCDPIDIGIRIGVGFGGSGDTAAPVLPGTTLNIDTAAPDPAAVVACATRLADHLPDAVRAQVAAAARMLTPLFFGYEALRMEVDPLMIFEDGSWMVGNVQMQIDENALFRHPELVSLVDRRGGNYLDVQRRRKLGLDFSVVDENGQIGLLTNGTALALLVMGELRARKLSSYNYIDLRASRIIEGSECLKTALEWIIAGPNIRSVLINLVSGNSDINVIAETLAQTLDKLATEMPVVLRIAGLRTEMAKKYFGGLKTNIAVVSDLETALDLVEQQAAIQATP